VRRIGIRTDLKTALVLGLTVAAAAVLLLVGCGGQATQSTQSSVTGLTTGGLTSTTESTATSSVESGTTGSSTAVASASTTEAPTTTQAPTTTEGPAAVEDNPPGDIPDNQAFVAYKAPTGFTVKIPEGWARVEGDSSTSFTDKLNTIILSWSNAAAAPTAAGVQSTEVPELQKTEKAFELRDVSTVKLPAGEAVLVTYRVNSEPNAVTGKQYRLDVLRYSFFNQGQRVDITLLSPVGADNVDPWNTVVKSLKWQ